MILPEFSTEVNERLRANERDEGLGVASKAFFTASIAARYSYNFRFLGRPVIQYPQDMIAIQSVFWETKPDLVIETGVAHGGSLVMSAAMLAVLDACDREGSGVEPPRRRVLGIDIDIRPHNAVAIRDHPLSKRIELIQGSSTSPDVLARARSMAAEARSVLVMLDSNHTHDHVLAELRAYTPLVTRGSYCVVFDTCIEYMSTEACAGRPWSVGNSPATAVKAFLSECPDFVVDRDIDAALMISVAPGGYLRRVH